MFLLTFLTLHNASTQVSLQEPLVYISHRIPPGEDPNSTLDAIRFRAKITVYAEAIKSILRNKISHSENCTLDDHSLCDTSTS